MSEPRPLTPDDAERAAETVRAVQEDLGYPVTGSAEQRLRDWWQWLDLESSSWAFEDDSLLSAFAWSYSRGDAADCGGFVHPAARGRGLGTRMADLSEEWARARGLGILRLAAFGRDVAGAELLEARGLREVRRYYELGLDLDGPPAEPAWPDGVHAATFRPEDARVFYETLTEAFADEWGFVSSPFEEWKRRRIDGCDTSLYFLAWDGAAAAGAIRCDADRPRTGWVGALGVLRPWRRRGVGEALLRHAFGELYARGVRRVGLGVDAQNETGAVRLYERAGMTVVCDDVVYEKALA